MKISIVLNDLKKNGVLLIFIAIIIKLFFFFYFSHNTNKEDFKQNIFYNISGDSPEYIQPVENLMEIGEYKTNEGNYATRMPGYAPILLLFRTLFSLKWALNLTLITQVILSGLSCYILALLASNLFSSVRLFYLVFISYTISTYVSIWDTHILTESFATSSLIFSFYFLELSIVKKNNKMLLYSGMFLAWCIFLRPYMYVLVGPYILIIVTQLINHKPIKQVVYYSLIFSIPIVVLEASWTIRNYVVTNEFIPLQSRISSNDGEIFANKNLDLKLIVADFVKTFGGDNCYWNPRGTTYWFFNEDSYTTRNPFPNVIFDQNELTYNKLILVKSMCMQIELGMLSLEKEIEYKNSIFLTLNKFYENYRINHPIHFYVGSRLVHLRDFIIHTGVYNLPFPPYVNQNIIHKLIKLFYFFVYLFVFGFGFISSLYFLLKNSKQDLIKFVFFSIPFYIIFLFPFVFKYHEFRQNTLSYPFLLVGGCYSLINLKKYLFSKIRIKNIT